MVRFLISIHVKILSLVLLILLVHALDIASTKSIRQKEANDQDRVALLEFKSKILHDPCGIMNSWNDSIHFCRWNGIQCGHKRKRVTSINLNDNGLVGYLSPSLGNLSFLRALTLRNNTFRGEIPPQFGQLFRLQVLNLSRNSLEGEIPASLSQCSNLVHLYLSTNMLVGRIPSEFGSLINLESLVIHKNNLTGVISPSIGNLTSLSLISAAENHLEGNLPEALGQLKNLRAIGLGENKLSGVIPPSIFNLSQLKVLSVSANQLTGSLPSELGLMLPQLQYLQLNDNQFTGLLPASLSNASELTWIDIGNNAFNGKIAIDFGGLKNLILLAASYNDFGSNGDVDGMNFLNTMTNCSNLVAVSLQDNQLKGILPNNIGNLSSKFLYYLSLAGNLIYGEIPTTLGNLINSESLFLESNQLTGTIPTTIGNLQKLKRLAFADNKLSRKIPEALGNLSFLNELYLDNNMLEGNIPPVLGNCQDLLLLGLSLNNLSGSIPKEIFGISSLSISLNLSHNHLSGIIPLEIGNLKNLAELDISANRLSGELPETFDGCRSIESLSLAGNFLEGSIPKSLSSLRGIQILDLSNNNFSGQIPQYLVNLSLKSLTLSFNNFVGEVPTQGVFGNTSAISVIGNKRLCGGIPELHLPECHIRESKKHKPQKVIILIVTTTFLFIGIILILIFGQQHYSKKRSSKQSLSDTTLFLKVSYRQLFQATNAFSAENLIGVGSFGSVFKGTLTEGRNLSVAVKVFNLLHHDAFKSFSAESEALRNIRHRNLVKTIASCSSQDFQGNDFKALVFEFMPNGSLENWLHSTESDDQQDKLGTLNLVQRINISIDVACAVDYLHHYCHRQIVHCDLKPSNILLDGDLTAHVGDFGLAKILHSPPNLQESSFAGIRGTVGYVAPEYGLGAEISTCGDVYSFGILLLEMMTGKRPTHDLFIEGLDLHRFVDMAIHHRVIMDIVDPILLHREHKAAVPGSKLEDCLISLLKVGLACSKDLPQYRMNMADVVSTLNSIRDTFNMDQERETGSNACRNP